MNKQSFFCFLVEASVDVYRIWSYIEFYIQNFTTYVYLILFFKSPHTLNGARISAKICFGASNFFHSLPFADSTAILCLPILEN